MPGLDPIIVMHRLAVEIDKLIETNFIREMTFPCQSSKSWWTQPLAMRHYHSWTAPLGIIKSAWLPKMGN
ncbi:hypothetical protein ACFX2C_007005 [Malus domestica]